MAKDPAVLWYWNDWHGGTITLSRHLKGCYMDLLYAQFNSGPLSIEEIKTILGNDFAAWQGSLSKKFSQTADGLFFNKKLHDEKQKRIAYSESRRNNLSSKPPSLKQTLKLHMDVHMENENENENSKERYVTFKNQCLTHERWQNDLCIACKIEMKDIPGIIDQYIAHIGAGGVIQETLADFKKHLRNWLLVKPKIDGYKSHSLKLGTKENPLPEAPFPKA